MIIEGAGINSEKLLVTDKGQASVLAEVHSEARQHSEEGEVFIVSTGFGVSSTSADTYTAMLYIKNTSNTKDLHFGYLRTCNEAAGKWRMVSAPTALGNTSISALNTNLSKTTPLDATLESFSAAGTTFSDGTATNMPQWIQGATAHSIQPFEGSFILGAQDSIGIEFAPFGTTAGDACITLQCWQIES